MKKLRTYLDTAVRYVKHKQKPSTAREVTLHEQPERALLDAEGEDSGQTPEVVEPGPLTVRSISGKIVHSQEIAGHGTRVMDIVSSVCESTNARMDEVHLMAGESILKHDMILGHGECVTHPGPGNTLEVSLAVVPGPSLTAHSMSGSRIEVLDHVPEIRQDCHFDRDYEFTSLGDFANKPGMHYIMTCNDDRKTSANKVMWRLDLREEAVVFINFRSQAHVQQGHALDWLRRDGWELQPDFKSTVSSGFPNGPYSGPVYAQAFCPRNRQHLVDLMGSNYWEGAYFVFVQMGSFAL